MTSISPFLKFIYAYTNICIRGLSITATRCNTLQHTQWHQYRLSSSLNMYIDSFAFEVSVLLQHAATHCKTRIDINITFPPVYTYIYIHLHSRSQYYALSGAVVLRKEIRVWPDLTLLLSFSAKNSQLWTTLIFKVTAQFSWDYSRHAQRWPSLTLLFSLPAKKCSRVLLYWRKRHIW